MFTEKDLEQIRQKGISLEKIDAQIKNFQDGFPVLELIKAAIPNDGIFTPNKEEMQEFENFYETESKKVQVMKFVPASGAASRMFKDLYEYVNTQKANKSVENVMDNLDKFAFYADLQEVASKNGKNLRNLLAEKDYKEIAELIILEKGLNYGNLPKALLKFHKYENFSRTSLEEHLVEGAFYCRDIDNIIHLHFTVSPEHLSGFENHLQEIKSAYESKFGVKYVITMSIQKPSTDTIAVDMSNNPFRNEDSSLLFRPGGHGALIENLNELDADTIHIKNIDNVVPDHLKDSTLNYKKILGGILLSYQQKVFEYLHLLDSEKYEISDAKLDEIGEFLQNELCILPNDNFVPKTKADRIAELIRKLNRPMRVGGMVKNEGEPGGGPFWVTNSDGTVSLQVVEDAQIDKNNTEMVEIKNSSTHFSPTDFVLGVKDYKGQKFNLLKYIDYNTGFISKKSKDGKDLKALELPGLWNGSMSDWISIFVEVPVKTFNPVKTINDLLRPEHS